MMILTILEKSKGAIPQPEGRGPATRLLFEEAPRTSDGTFILRNYITR